MLVLVLVGVGVGVGVGRGGVGVGRGVIRGGWWTIDGPNSGVDRGGSLCSTKCSFFSL